MKIMYEENGIGLAANQVGVGLNILVIFSIVLLFHFIVFPILGFNPDLPSWAI